MRLIPKHQTPQGTSTIQVPSLLNIPGLDLQTGLARAYQSMGLASPMVDTSTPEGVSYAINQAQNNVAREEQARKEDAEAEMEFRRKNPWVTDAPGGTDTPTNLVFGGLPALKAVTIPLKAAGNTLLGRLGFGALGAANLASEEGVKKTARLIREGNYARAGVSALGDALDLTMIGGGLKAIRPIVNFSPQPLSIGAAAGETGNSTINISKIIQDNGKIRLRLDSHTPEKPREFVLDPQGDNKFYAHMRTWDGDHIPAALSSNEKNALFNAAYEALPEGGEILVPQSGEGFLATRGTVAGMLRLARDPRFIPGRTGSFLYLDKDGTIKTFNTSSFVKASANTNTWFDRFISSLPIALKPRYNLYSFIRQVKDDAVKDMKATKSLRSSAEAGANKRKVGRFTLGKQFDEQMFYTGRPFYGNNSYYNYLIVPRRPLATKAEATNNGMEWLFSSHKNHTGAARYVAKLNGLNPEVMPGQIVVPSYNGELGNIPLSEIGPMDLYEPIKLFNWRLPLYKHTKFNY